MTSAPVGRSQVKPEALGLSSLSSFPGETSSARAQMWTSHMGQTLVVNGATPARVQTGTEGDFGKYTFGIRMPVNATIIKVIPRYPRSIGYDNIEENPSSLVIFEDHETHEIGVVEMKKYSIHHQHFGFRYKTTHAGENKLYPGATIAKGTPLAQSPNLGEDGTWDFGVEANVILMSHQGIIEDGVIVRRGFLKNISSKGYKTVVLECGKKRFPLNIHARNEEEYRPLPDIGHRVGEDGLLYALREYNPILAPVLMNKLSLRYPEAPHDTTCYVPPGSKVVDIKVLRDNRRGHFPQTPVGMEVQFAKYERASARYYKQILETYRTLRAERRRQGQELRISDRFQWWIVQALADDPANSQERITRTYRNTPLDDWRVEITLEYDVIPDIGAKITAQDGDKGVICGIEEDEDMPRDDFGNVADFIMDGDSSGKRMNMGRLYRMYIGENMRHQTKVLRKMVEDKVPTGEIWDFVLDYYSIISPTNVRALSHSSYKGSPKSHIDSIVKDGFYAIIPTDNEIEAPDIVRQLRDRYPAPQSPVTYRGRSGKMVRTKQNMRIGSTYILTLEKDGKDWAAVASAKIGHFGFPSKISPRHRYAEPGRGNPTRITGEAEDRLFEAVAKGSSAELIEMSNNPKTHEAIYRSLVMADKPTAIKKIVDREKNPRGEGRNLTYPKHILECGGIGFIDIDPETGVTRAHL